MEAVMSTVKVSNRCWAFNKNIQKRRFEHTAHIAAKHGKHGCSGQCVCCGKVWQSDSDTEVSTGRAALH